MGKNRIVTLLLVLVLLGGACVVGYPRFADYWNRMHAAHVIDSYEQAMNDMDREAFRKMLERAEKYNRKIAKRGLHLSLPKGKEKEYEKQLKIDESGIMGYIDIPSINCSLPIGHGTSEKVLETCIGHIPGTSLPIGGPSTHSVLSGHRGLPSAKLFSDLDQVKEGDYFSIRILDKILYYRVDQILTVLPDETDCLEIEEGKDLVTLVTCTPYGVNTHRLLVRGHRVDHMEGHVETEHRVLPDAAWVSALHVGLVTGLPLLILFLLSSVIRRYRSRRRYRRRSPYFTDAELMKAEDIGMWLWVKKSRSGRKKRSAN